MLRCKNSQRVTYLVPYNALYINIIAMRNKFLAVRLINSNMKICS